MKSAEITLLFFYFPSSVLPLRAQHTFASEHLSPWWTSKQRRIKHGETWCHITTAGIALTFWLPTSLQPSLAGQRSGAKTINQTQTSM